MQKETTKIPVSAYEAGKRMKEAYEKKKPFKEALDAAFDGYLETSDRPITLRDLMFALAVIDEIASTMVERLEEIHQDVPERERIYSCGTFSCLEHSLLRESLVELYFAHAGASRFPQEYWDAYAAWQKVHDDAQTAHREYTEAREREGLQSGEEPQPPKD
jgi:hypothetical protein